MRRNPRKPESRTSKTKHSSRYAEALAKARLAPQGGQYWNPMRKKNPDTPEIAGKVISMKERKGKFGQQTVLTLELEDGTHKMVSGTTVLESLIEENAVTVGSEIALVYHGQSKGGKKGRPAHLFNLQVIE